MNSPPTPDSTPRPRRCLAAGLLAGLVLLGSAPASAQRAKLCAEALIQAQRDFEIGRFEAVIGGLEGCVPGGLTPIETKTAYELLARTHLALDDVERAEALIAELVALDPTYTPSARASGAFAERVAAAQKRSGTVTISSVSKTSERLLEAPATAVVITSEEIESRGYLDLEQILHDLPAFDISRGNGVVYSNFYQRGYRSSGNDRTLFLVDGVEENDIWSNIAYLSRQYPLSNVDRVEVIYGPASTMYGPNAFVGVINVITHSPRVLTEGDKRWRVSAESGFGEHGTSWADATAAASTRDGNLAFSITGRVYRSDELDRSSFPTWDYDPAFYDAFPYAERLFVPADRAERIDLASPFVEPVVEGGEIVGYTASAEGIARARALDRAALALPVEGRPVGFSDLTEDWSVYGKLQFRNLIVGFQTWRREEGFNSWYTDNFYAGAENGTLWVPRQSFFYAKYSGDVNPRLRFGIFARFKEHRLDSDTHEQQIRNYSNRGLRLDHLAPADPPPGCAPPCSIDPFWQTTFYRQSSRQFRTEMTLTYEPSTRFNLVAGVEARSGSIQGDYVLEIFREADPDNDFNPSDPDGFRDDTEDLDLQVFDQLDLGFFAQASYRPSDDWKFVLGGRLDDNQVSGQVSEASGYGTVFNPRLAAIYTPGDWVFKAIYAEAFKDASNFNRYATAPGIRELQNPDLEPERVENFELTAGWQVRENLFVDVAAYRARYSNAVVTRFVEEAGTRQNQAPGSLDIRGLQANFRGQFGRFNLWANYTYTEPTNTNPLDGQGEPRLGADGEPLGEVRVGDIAEHRVSAGFDTELGRHWRFDLRLNHVGERETGFNPSIDDDILGNRLETIDAYTVAHATVTYEDLIPGGDLQLVAENLFDEDYVHPGVRSADGSVFASSLPQNGRGLYFRLRYRY